MTKIAKVKQTYFPLSSSFNFLTLLDLKDLELRFCRWWGLRTVSILIWILRMFWSRWWCHDNDDGSELMFMSIVNNSPCRFRVSFFMPGDTSIVTFSRTKGIIYDCLSLEWWWWQDSHWYALSVCGMVGDGGRNVAKLLILDWADSSVNLNWVQLIQQFSHGLTTPFGIYKGWPNCYSHAISYFRIESSVWEYRTERINKTDFMIPPEFQYYGWLWFVSSLWTKRLLSLLSSRTKFGTICYCQCQFHTLF